MGKEGTATVSAIVSSSETNIQAVIKVWRQQEKVSSLLLSSDANSEVSCLRPVEMADLFSSHVGSWARELAASL